MSGGSKVEWSSPGVEQSGVRHEAPGTNASPRQKPASRRPPVSRPPLALLAQRDAAVKAFVFLDVSQILDTGVEDCCLSVMTG